MFRPYLLVVLLCSSVAWPQTAQPDVSPKPYSVTLPIFAEGHAKHPYADLKPGDLTILDNKQPVRSIVSLRKGSELPLSIGLLLDASGSQRSSELYQPILRAATDFLNQILTRPEDRVLMVKVTTKPETSPLMSRSQFANFKLNVTPEGGTALYDGIALACDSLVEGGGPDPSRRVLVLLSDGDDNQSHIPRKTVIEKAIQAGVVIFSLSTMDERSTLFYPESQNGNNTLKHLANETGGEALLHLKSKKIEQSFQTISEAIKNTYFVTFEPTANDEQGFHPIEVKASGSDGMRLQAPKSYYHP